MFLFEHVLQLNNKLWLCFDIVSKVENKYLLIKMLHILEPFPHLLLEQELEFILRGNMPQHVQFAVETEYTVLQIKMNHNLFTLMSLKTYVFFSVEYKRR